LIQLASMNTIQKVLLNDLPNNGKFYTVAIDGRAGSGKTTLAKIIKTQLPDFVHLNGDDYFEPVENKVEWGAFNDERFINDVVKPLQNNRSFSYYPYDWHKEPHITRRDITVEHGLCLERCYSFNFDLDWDLKVWVETPRDLCLKRGVARERLPRETVLKTWKEVWQPLEDAYIAKTNPAKYADIVIYGARSFKAQLAEL
jgi:uridine kinase